MGENAIADLIDYLSANGPPDNMKESGCQLILRALRLLAAAEGGEGTPETDAVGLTASEEAFPRRMTEHARTLEQRCNGLAARVAELERAVDLAARAMAGEGVEDQGQAWDRCLRILDAARSQP